MAYDSQGDDGWMGKGWDLDVPRITVETRWGAPRYSSGSGAQETEDYLLDGEQLIEETSQGPYLAHRMAGIGTGTLSFINRIGGPVTFYTRVESEFKRIIRNGNGPANYYWEVDEKDGTRAFYGGSKESGQVENGTGDSAVLTDNSGSTTNTGNVFEWALRETEDPHGNTVKYHYAFTSYAPITTAGPTGNTGGNGLYLDHVAYTGSNGSDGPYQVKFFRAGPTGGAYNGVTTSFNVPRPDIQVYAKGGFFISMADVLDHVDVTLNGGLVRRYQFSYTTGAFFKTLLSSIQQFGPGGYSEPFPGNTHNFQYYNEVQSSTGNPMATYTGFASPVTWTTPLDSTGFGLPSSLQNVVTDLLYPMSPLDVSDSIGVGGTFYGGISAPLDFEKFFSVGAKVGLNTTDSFGLLTMIDMNGDGLPDILFVDSSLGLSYCPNMGNGSFGPPIQVSGISNISNDVSLATTYGVEGYFGINGMDDYTTSWDWQLIYFTDANDDGIPDLVNNGTVYFGHVNPLTNAVSYSTDSSDTPAPLGSASAGAVLPVDNSMVEQEASSNPLVDTLRQWTAPYNGTIQITAPVTLLNAAPSTYTAADGVRAAIEYDTNGSGGSVLTSASIPPAVTSPQALSSSLVVNKGDRLYFRLQSVFDGRYDQVGWDPQIQYSAYAGVTDVNNLPQGLYRPSTDFTLAGLRGVTINMPSSGTVSIWGDFQKLGATTDAVTAVIVKTTFNGTTVTQGPTTLFTAAMAATQTGTVSLSSAVSNVFALPVTNVQGAPLTCVSAGTTTISPAPTTQIDQLAFVIHSDTNIDLSQVQWNPQAAYTSLASPTPNACTGLTPPAASVTDGQGNYTIRLKLPVQTDFYPENNLSSPLQAFVVAVPTATAAAPPNPAPTPPTPSSTPTGTATVPPTPTPIPAGKGVLYLNGPMTISGATASSIGVTVFLNAVPQFTFTVPQAAASEVISITGQLGAAVTTGDTLLVAIGLDTQADLDEISWTPSLYYVNPFTIPPSPLAAASGPSTLQPAYEAVLSSNGTTIVRPLSLVPSLGAALAGGTFVFTMKQPLSLSNKFAYSSSQPSGFSPIAQDWVLGDAFYLNFTSDSEAVTLSGGATEGAQSLLSNLGVSAVYGGTAGTTVAAPFEYDSPGNGLQVVTVSGNPTTLVFPAAYRGWSNAGLENDPALSSGASVTGPTNGMGPTTALNESALSIPNVSSSAPASQQSAAVSAMRGVFFYPDGLTDTWAGPTSEIFVAPVSMCSSRLNTDNIMLPPGTAGVTVAAGQRSLTGAPVRESFSSDNVAGGGFLIFSYSQTTSPASSNVAQDYVDLNGDGYPDVITQNTTGFPGNSSQVEFTYPSGTFQPSPTSLTVTIDQGSESVTNFAGGNPVAPSPSKTLKGLRSYAGNLRSASGGRARGGTVTSKGDSGAGKGDGGAGGAGRKAGDSVEPIGSAGVALGASSDESSLIDMNGDGLPDEVSVDSNGNLLVALNTGYGFAAAQTWATGVPALNQSHSFSFNVGAGFNDTVNGFAGGVALTGSNSTSTATLTDVNGDGLPDLITLSGSGQWLVRFNTGTGLAPAVTWTGQSANQAVTVMEDANGDGLPDLVEYYPSGAVSVQYNYGVAMGYPQSYSLTGAVPSQLESGYSMGIGGGFAVNISIPVFVLVVPIFDIELNPGADFSSSMDCQRAKLIDMNGDGYLDQVLATNDLGQILVSLNLTGKTNLLSSVSRPMGGQIVLDYGAPPNSYNDPTPPWILSDVSIYDGGANKNAAHGGADWQAFTYDYSGDLYDRFDRAFLGFSAVTVTARNTTGWAGPTTLSGPASLTAMRQVVDRYFNANVYEKGLRVEDTVLDDSGASPVTYVDKNFAYTFTDVLASSPTTYPEGMASTLLAANVVFPQLSTTTTALTEPTSTGAVTTGESFAYDPYGNVTNYVDQGDGSADAVTAVVSYTAEDPDTNFTANYLVGLPENITVSGAGVTLRQRQILYDDVKGDPVTFRKYLADGTYAESDMSYDPNTGNLLQVIGSANLHSQRYQVNYQYDSVVGAYPVYTHDSLGYTSTESYDYRFGLPSVDVDENNNRTQEFYDGFGRMVTVIGPLDSASGHFTLAFDYHPEAYLTSGGVPWAHTAHFDPARGTSATLDTLLFTDGFDRPIQTKATATLFAGVSQTPQNQVVVSGRVVFDSLGRILQHYYPVVEAGNSSTMDTTNTVFNTSYDTEPPLTNLYDVLNRPTTTTYQDATHETAAYFVGQNNNENQLESVFTDRNGHPKQAYRDVRGLVEAMREFPTASTGINTLYFYDPLGELTGVTDANGNVTSIVYDQFGRRSSIQSPDKGKTLFTYDTASNLIKKTTANLAKENKAATYDYDYNRILSGSYPDYPRNNFTYTYGLPGAPLNQANRVATVQDASGVLSLAYDALGNAVTETRVVLVPQANSWEGEAAWDSGKQPTTPVTYMTGYLYDDWDRMLQMTYPDGEVLTYQYDAGGLPRSALGIVRATGSSQASAGTAFPYVLRMEYDKFGDRVFLQNGNGTQSTYTYDPLLDRLSNLTTSSGTFTFQNLSYSYDPVGNLKALNNRALAPSGGLGGPVSQSFAYDGLNQLTSASGLYSQAFNTSTGADFASRYSLALTYDPIHNLTEKNQVVADQVQGSSQGFVPDNTLTYDWQYQYKGTQPHAPSLIGTRSFTYDFNGNQSGFTDLAGTSRTILWDEEDRMEAVEDGAEALASGGVRFTYDAQGARVLKLSSPDKMTAYVNQFYTVENAQNGPSALPSKNIFVGTQRIATHLVSAAVSTTGSGSNISQPAQWIGSWGVSIAAGNNDAINFGSPGNFVTVERDGTQVLGSPQIWTKGSLVLGTVNSCQVLTLTNPKPQGGYFLVLYNNQPGYIPANSAVVGLPTSCLQTSVQSQTSSGLPKNSFVFFYHTDHLGSTGYLTDENGALAEHLEYLPFGETWVEQATGTQLFPDYQFTGTEFDPETNLYWFGNRYYDPRTSLWQSPDPTLSTFLTPEKNSLYDSTSFALYSYARNNPLVSQRARASLRDSGEPDLISQAETSQTDELIPGYDAADVEKGEIKLDFDPDKDEEEEKEGKEETEKKEKPGEVKPEEAEKAKKAVIGTKTNISHQEDNLISKEHEGHKLRIELWGSAPAEHRQPADKKEAPEAKEPENPAKKEEGPNGPEPGNSPKIENGAPAEGPGVGPKQEGPAGAGSEGGAAGAKEETRLWFKDGSDALNGFHLVPDQADGLFPGLGAQESPSLSLWNGTVEGELPTIPSTDPKKKEDSPSVSLPSAVEPGERFASRDTEEGF